MQDEVRHAVICRAGSDIGEKSWEAGRRMGSGMCDRGNADRAAALRREYCITRGSAGVGGGFKLVITARGSRQGTLSFVTGQEAGEPGEVRRGETPCGLLHDRLRGAAREANRGAVSTGHGSRRPGRVDPNAQGRHGLLLVVRVLLDAERRGVSQQAYSP